jgi:hypothetical protein
MEAVMSTFRFASAGRPRQQIGAWWTGRDVSLQVSLAVGWLLDALVRWLVHRMQCRLARLQPADRLSYSLQ